MKRLSLHHEALQRLIDSLIVDLIAESLESISYSEDISKARSVMQEKRFDVLGVINDKGKVIGYIASDDLKKGIVGDFRKDFSIDEIVSFSAPLGDHILDIYEKGRLFVLGNNGIESIVTTADLQKMPVRLMLFGVVSLLEMVFLAWIRKQYPHEEWRKMLCEDRIKKAEELYEDRRRRNQEIDLADCLQLCDKRDVLLKTGNNILNTLGFCSKNAAKEYLEQIEDLRNGLAHAQDLPKAMNMEWRQIAELTRVAKDVTKRLIDFVEGQSKKRRPDAK